MPSNTTHMRQETKYSLMPLGIMLAMFFSVCLSMVVITIISAVIDWLK